MLSSLSLQVVENFVLYLSHLINNLGIKCTFSLKQRNSSQRVLAKELSHRMQILFLVQ